MNSEQFKKYNILFYIDDCPKCRILCEFIGRLNQKLTIENNIKMINCTYYQKYGIVSDQLILLFNKHFDGFPTLFFKGIKVAGANSRIESEAFLHDLYEEFFVVKEDNRKFKKECEYIKKGALRGKIKCQ